MTRCFAADLMLKDTAAGLMQRRPLDLRSLFWRNMTRCSAAGLIQGDSSHLSNLL